MSLTRSHRLSFLILLCSLSLGAQVGAPVPVRPYVGFTVGSQHTEVARADQAGLTPLDRGTLGLLAGATFGPTWGAELGFHFLGRFPAGSTTDAYGTVDWANTQILFGQTTDIFGPTTSSTIDNRTGDTRNVSMVPSSSGAAGVSIGF